MYKSRHPSYHKGRTDKHHRSGTAVARDDRETGHHDDGYGESATAPPPRKAQSLRQRSRENGAELVQGA